MAVVKANAYGHDVLQCAPLLATAEAQWLGVTCAEEGAAVRAVCPQSRILLMSGVFPGEADTVIDQGLTPWYGSRGIWTCWRRLRLPPHAGGEPRGSPGNRYRHVTAGRAHGRRPGFPGSRFPVASFSPRFLPAAGRSDDPLLRAGSLLVHPAQCPVSELGAALDTFLRAACARSGCMPATRRPSSLDPTGRP